MEDREMIEKVFSFEKFVNFQELFDNFDFMRRSLRKFDEAKLDEFYFTAKSILNDYKAIMLLITKINHLLNYQHLFCEKIQIDNIFDQICDIVCVILDCDRCTLYIVDNIRKELWSRSAKGIDTLIKIPIGKGIAGYVAQNKRLISIEDAYFDPRFNKEFDKKMGYRTKSILCLPIFDSYSHEVIGVIQALNKRTAEGIFDKNDEVISEILCKMIYNQLKQSMEYSDYANYDYKLKKIVNNVHKFYMEDNIFKLISLCSNILVTLFTTDNVSILFKNPEDDKYYKIFSGNLKEVEISSGIVCKVYTSKNYYFCFSTYNDSYFNPIIDIDTSLPMVTYPVFDNKNEEIIAILQIEYTMSKLSFGDNIEKKMDNLDLDIINLLALNMSSSLSLLRFKLKNYKASGK